MILSNYEEFMQFVPTTFDSNQDIELFREWVDIAEYTAGFNLFGTELYQAISALPDNDNFRVLCKRYICHSALYEAIPNLDLILTPNGFAVVGGSNSQFVPASKDRVAALRLQEDVWTEKFREMIIRRIAISPELFKLWTKKEAFAGNLFVGYDDFRTYCAADDMRNPAVYRQAVTRIAKWMDSIIYPALSRRQCTAVIAAQYSGENEAAGHQILTMVKQAAGILVRANDPTESDYNAVKHILAAAVTIMQRNPDDYPEYISSREYELSIREVYENKRDHATFFGAI